MPLFADVAHFVKALPTRCPQPSPGLGMDGPSPTPWAMLRIGCGQRVDSARSVRCDELDRSDTFLLVTSAWRWCGRSKRHGTRAQPPGPGRSSKPGMARRRGTAACRTLQRSPLERRTTASTGTCLRPGDIAWVMRRAQRSDKWHAQA